MRAAAKYNAKRDANEPEIVSALVDMGCKVLRLDVFDLLVLTLDGRVLMVEVKTESGKLTKKQEELLLNGWPLHIVRSTDEMRELIESVEFVA